MKTPSRAPSGPLGAQPQRRRAQVRVLAHAGVEGVVEQHRACTVVAPGRRVPCGHERIRSRRCARDAPPRRLRDGRRGALVHARGAPLGYTQSAVSHQMATLERLVGKQLIERPRGTEAANLTEAGEILHRHARALISRVKLAYDDLDGLAEGVDGDVPVRHLPERQHEHPAARAAPLRAAVPARARAPHRVGRGSHARARPRGGQARRVVRDAADARGPALGDRAPARPRTSCSSPRTRRSPAARRRPAWPRSRSCR